MPGRLYNLQETDGPGKVMADDQEIIARVLGGDIGAFGLLVRRYERAVLCMAQNLVQDRHDAEEIAQDAFVAAYQNLHRYEPARCVFSTWLLTIAKNRCLNSMKKKRPRAMAVLPPIPDRRTPDEYLEGKELLEALDLALAGLPPGQKTAFVLPELVGLSTEEVALIEGVEAGTIRSRLSRAKAALRSSMNRFAGVEQ
jgi:RNA polymerase sigma-70 factor (ECF subfamily)